MKPLAGPLAGQVALVTGASRGIGAATAVELARHGAHVILLARTQGGLEETDDAIRALGGTATLLPMDLMDGLALDPIGPSIAQRFGRLDILIHAAATLGKLTPAGHIQPGDWEQVVGTNLTAAWRLIRTTDPLLRAAPAGRAVFLTDSLVHAPRAYWGAYGATKAGMEHLALSWAAECANTDLRVQLFDPGPVATRLRANALPGENTGPLPKPNAAAKELLEQLLPPLPPGEGRGEGSNMNDTRGIGP